LNDPKVPIIQTRNLAYMHKNYLQMFLKVLEIKQMILEAQNKTNKKKDLNSFKIEQIHIVLPLIKFLDH
jgi:hypothetical protein